MPVTLGFAMRPIAWKFGKRFPYTATRTYLTFYTTLNNNANFFLTIKKSNQAETSGFIFSTGQNKKTTQISRIITKKLVEIREIRVRKVFD